MEAIILPLVLLLALVLRAVTIYIAAGILVSQPENLLVKSAAIGIFAGLLTFVMVIFPLGGLLVLFFDYYLVKFFFGTTRMTAFMIVIVAGLLGEVPVFVIQNTLLA